MDQKRQYTRPQSNSTRTTLAHSPSDTGHKRQRSNSIETAEPSSQINGRRRARKPNDDSLKLACPFCKYRQDLWGGIGDCGTYSNPNIATIIRHHVLDKHQKKNEEFDSSDPRRINPGRFEALTKWRGSISLRQDQAKGLWMKMYKILFDSLGSSSMQLPDPEFTHVLADNAINQIDAQLRRKILGESALGIRSQFAFFSVRKAEIEKQCDIEKNYVNAYFDPQVHRIEEIRQEELQRCDQRCAIGLNSLAQTYITELNSSQQPRTGADLQFAGSAPSQFVPHSQFQWRSVSNELIPTSSASNMPEVHAEPSYTFAVSEMSTMLHGQTCGLADIETTSEPERGAMTRFEPLQADTISRVQHKQHRWH